MHRVVAVLMTGGALLAVAPAAAAQTPNGNPCAAARAPARADLALAAQFNPAGVGPSGWAPLAQPWGPDPWGAPLVFGPPGPAGTAAPLGPGLTANTIAAFAQQNGGIDDQLLIDLASQQQTELGTLQTRYGLAVPYQVAGALWARGLASTAAADRQILSALCRSHQMQSAARAAPETAASPPTTTQSASAESQP